MLPSLPENPKRKILPQSPSAELPAVEIGLAAYTAAAPMAAGNAPEYAAGAVLYDGDGTLRPRGV